MTQGIFPDGSGFFMASFQLPKDHWLYAPQCEKWDSERDTSADTPVPILNNEYRKQVIAAIRYAVRGATMNGREMNFDPDALVLKAAYALCGQAGNTARVKECPAVERGEAATTNVDDDDYQRANSRNGGKFYPTEATSSNAAGQTTDSTGNGTELPYTAATLTDERIQEYCDDPHSMKTPSRFTVCNQAKEANRLRDELSERYRDLQLAENAASRLVEENDQLRAKLAEKDSPK